ncbi:hypothetical protein M885DRAFT_610575 [Pelagophyceae sp. CCMP2097]|nr:hypothetical protein M885DRAFT_610575 [Pelagophyceae sp. CCMP2097]
MRTHDGSRGTILKRKLEGETAGDAGEAFATKKSRFVWPEELHVKFVGAVFDVGLRCSSGQAIIAAMQAHAAVSDEIERLLVRYRATRGVMRNSAGAVGAGDDDAVDSPRKSSERAAEQAAHAAAILSLQKRDLGPERAELTLRCHAIAKQQSVIALHSEELVRRFQKQLRASIDRTSELGKLTPPESSPPPPPQARVAALFPLTAASLDLAVATRSKVAVAASRVVVAAAGPPDHARSPVAMQRPRLSFQVAQPLARAAPPAPQSGKRLRHAAFLDHAAAAESLTHSAAAQMMAVLHDDGDDEFDDDDGAPARADSRPEARLESRPERPSGVIVRAFNWPGSHVEASIQSEMEQHMSMHREMLMRKDHQLTLFQAEPPPPPPSQTPQHHAPPRAPPFAHAADAANRNDAPRHDVPTSHETNRNDAPARHDASTRHAHAPDLYAMPPPGQWNMDDEDSIDEELFNFLVDTE